MMHDFATTTLIAALDWHTLLPIVFLIVYIVNYLLSLGKQPPGRNVPRRNIDAQLPPRPRQAAAPGNQDELNREIEEFLKRAAETRRDKTTRPAEAMLSSGGQPVKAARSATETPVDVEVVAASRLSDNVSASVERHLGQRGFNERAEHLSEDITRVDAEMEQHVQQTFRHRLGTLEDTSRPSQEAASRLATDEAPSVVQQQVSPLLTTAIANRDNLRQAFILNEILTRVEDRWD
jgi:hypothetical protein